MVSPAIKITLLNKNFILNNFFYDKIIKIVFHLIFP